LLIPPLEEACTSEIGVFQIGTLSGITAITMVIPKSLIPLLRDSCTNERGILGKGSLDGNKAMSTY
jgi:hypothetical protein